MPAEILLVSAGDRILSAGGQLPPEWAALAVEDRYGDPLPGHLLERPDERTAVTYKGRPFTVSTVIQDCYGVLRSIYTVHGQDGVEDFLSVNEAVLRQGQMLDPELFQESGFHLYRLFQEANRHLSAHVEAALPKVEAAARAQAWQRLNEWRLEAESEAVRYFRGIDNPDKAAQLLASDFAGHAHLFDGTFADVKALQAELQALQPLLRRTGDAQKRWEDARRRLFLEMAQARRPTIGSRQGQEFRELREIEEILRRVSENPEVERLDMLAREQREILIRHISAIATEFPIIWRCYATPVSDDPLPLGIIVLRELRATWQANRALFDELASNPGLIWRLPQLIRGLLAEAGVTPYSVTWTASEERLGEETGPSTASIISMVAGLSQLGVSGVAALAGATAVAPPIGIGLFIVEALFSLVDAVQEYQDYRFRNAAFRASLDPEQALASEPSLLSAVITIGFDLVSLVPPARAGAAVP